MSNPLQPSWTQNNIVAFRDFIAKNQDFFGFLETKRPPRGGNNIEEAALNARLRDGFSDAVDALKAMAKDIPADTSGGNFVDIQRD